jgi:hypothetical protein
MLHKVAVTNEQRHLGCLALAKFCSVGNCNDASLVLAAFYDQCGQVAAAVADHARCHYRDLDMSRA